MTEACQVSVVVPVYNGASFLEDCLASALAQTLPAIEVLVIDDGSTDDSPRIVERVASRDPRVRLLRHARGENRGVSHSRQLGVRQARGRYIAFLDADDVFEREKLERQLDALEAHRECVLCHTAVCVMGDGAPHMAQQLEDHFNQLGDRQIVHSFHDRADALRVNFLCNSTCLVPTARIRDLHFAIPQLFQYEDFLLWTLLSRAGPFLYLPQQLTRYRYHQKSATAAIVKNELAGLYSRLELLLALRALIDDERLRGRAHQELTDTLAALMNVYSQKTAPTCGGLPVNVAVAGSPAAAPAAVDAMSAEATIAFSEDALEYARIQQLQKELAATRTCLARREAEVAAIVQSRTWRAVRRARQLVSALCGACGSQSNGGSSRS